VRFSSFLANHSTSLSWSAILKIIWKAASFDNPFYALSFRISSDSTSRCDRPSVSFGLL
jgi:hypothetical protein